MDTNDPMKNIGKEIEKDMRQEVNAVKTEVTKEAKKNANKALWITGVVLVIIVAFFVTNGFGLFDKNQVTTLEIGKSPVLGNQNASVTIYEFSDFSCPFCAAVSGYGETEIAILKKQDPNWEAPLPKIINDYIKTGKVKLVFKYFPTHGTGTAAQLVGYCLNDQNLFWQFYDLAFANQKDTISFDKMKTLAQTINANMTQLASCLDSEKYNSMLTEDENMGKKAGISVTPTFFINGEKLEGAQSYPIFKKIIDSKI